MHYKRNPQCAAQQQNNRSIDKTHNMITKGNILQTIIKNLTLQNLE